MSLASEIAAAATEAQGYLAQIGGMDSSADGNTFYNGATLTLVYGTPRVVEMMNPGGGYRKRTEIEAVMTRAQVSAAPRPRETLTRIDLSSHVTYRIESVDTDGPINYTLVLVKVGD